MADRSNLHDPSTQHLADQATLAFSASDSNTASGPGAGDAPISDSREHPENEETVPFQQRREEPRDAVATPPAEFDRLAAFEPFANLPRHVQDIIEAAMYEHRFAPGESLIRQGEPGTSLMLLSSGTVEIASRDVAGNRQFIARTGAGDVLGEMALLTDEPRSADVVALTPVRAKILPAERFHELARQYPRISVLLTHLVASRLGRAERDALTDKTLGGYLIRRRLGEGGMAIVYEAQDVFAHRRVALKMMSHRLVYDQTALQLFHREAETIQTLDHPHIVRMYGRFQAFHTFFIVMEFCDGVALDDVLRRHGPLPELVFRKAIGQVAEGLTFAHRSGVVHRDVKPSNIMVTREGIIKLMDFGLAQPLDEDFDSAADGQIVGTPCYSAPEQLSGQRVGKEADYFSLACTAYKMLTGKALFRQSDYSVQFTDSRLTDFCPTASRQTIQFLRDCLRNIPSERAPDLDMLRQWAAPLSPAEMPSWIPEGRTNE